MNMYIWFRHVHGYTITDLSILDELTSLERHSTIELQVDKSESWHL